MSKHWPLAKPWPLARDPLSKPRTHLGGHLAKPWPLARDPLSKPRTHLGGRLAKPWPLARGRWALVTLTLWFLAIICLTMFSFQTTAAKADPTQVLTDRALEEIQSTTGLALSPGLVMFVKGGITYLKADDKKTLPWHSQGRFLLLLGALLGLFLLKDFIPFEPLQKLLMAGENGVMKLLGLLAVLSVIPGLSDIFAPGVQAALDGVNRFISSSPALADSCSSSGGAGHGLYSPAAGPIAGLISGLVGMVIFVAVFLVANAINVLCLLAPGFAALVLKGFRVTLVGGLTALGLAHPLLGFLAALFIIIFCLILMGWSLRLTIWGSLFSFDLIFRRWRLAPEVAVGQPGLSIQAFAGARARKDLKIPKRTIGRLGLENGRLYFFYRKLFLFKRVVPLEGYYMIGQTLTAPILATALPNGGYGELFFFRLKTKGHEEYLKNLLMTAGVETFGLRKGAAKTLAWLKSLFKSSENQPLSA